VSGRRAETLPEALARLADAQPDTPALHLDTGDVCFAALEERARRFASGFVRHGIGTGDCVAIWLPNTTDWLCAFFGLARLGAVALLANTRFRRSEMTDILRRAQAKAILLQPGFRAIDFLGILGECLPELRQLRLVVTAGSQSGELVGRTLHDADALASSPPSAEMAAGPDSPCLLFTTSGTTRRPKLVVHTHRSILAHAHDVAAGFGFAREAGGVLQMLPLCGTFGFTQAIATLLAGRPLALHPAFETEVARRMIARHGIARSAMTDDMARRLCAAPPPGGALPPGFRIITGSRAQELLPLVREHGLRVTGIYGSSEVQALFSGQRDSADPLRMAEGGGWPVSGEARVRARDPDTGDLCAFEEPGEIEIRAPSLAAGYLGDAEATARAFTPDGFFCTGDLGVVREDGSFRYITRLGEAFRLNGFLVSPLELEEIVLQHTDAQGCQVVGIEMDGRTQVVAFVVPQPGRMPSEEDLRAHCRASMAHYKVPARIVLVDAFPTIESANNIKIHRTALREMARRVLEPEPGGMAPGG
jgi:fatty-acyl-CoA synthase